MTINTNLHAYFNALHCSVYVSGQIQVQTVIWLCSVWQQAVTMTQLLDVYHLRVNKGLLFRYLLLWIFLKPEFVDIDTGCNFVCFPFCGIPEVPVGEIKVRTLTAGLFSQQRRSLGTSEGKISADNKVEIWKKFGMREKEGLMFGAAPFIGPFFFQSGCRFCWKIKRNTHLKAPTTMGAAGKPQHRGIMDNHKLPDTNPLIKGNLTDCGGPTFLT